MRKKLERTSVEECRALFLGKKMCFHAQLDNPRSNNVTSTYYPISR